MPFTPGGEQSSHPGQTSGPPVPLCKPSVSVLMLAWLSPGTHRAEAQAPHALQRRACHCHTSCQSLLRPLPATMDGMIISKNTRCFGSSA